MFHRVVAIYFCCIFPFFVFCFGVVGFRGLFRVGSVFLFIAISTSHGGCCVCWLAYCVCETTFMGDATAVAAAEGRF